MANAMKTTTQSTEVGERKPASAMYLSKKQWKFYPTKNRAKVFIRSHGEIPSAKGTEQRIINIPCKRPTWDYPSCWPQSETVLPVAFVLPSIPPPLKKLQCHALSSSFEHIPVRRQRFGFYPAKSNHPADDRGCGSKPNPPAKALPFLDIPTRLFI